MLHAQSGLAEGAWVSVLWSHASSRVWEQPHLGPHLQSECHRARELEQQQRNAPAWKWHLLFLSITHWPDQIPWPLKSQGDQGNATLSHAWKRKGIGQLSWLSHLPWSPSIKQVLACHCLSTLSYFFIVPIILCNCIIYLFSVWFLVSFHCWTIRSSTRKNHVSRLILWNSSQKWSICLICLNTEYICLELGDPYSNDLMSLSVSPFWLHAHHSPSPLIISLYTMTEAKAKANWAFLHMLLGSKLEN